MTIPKEENRKAWGKIEDINNFLKENIIRQEVFTPNEHPINFYQPQVDTENNFGSLRDDFFRFGKLFKFEYPNVRTFYICALNINQVLPDLCDSLTISGNDSLFLTEKEIELTEKFCEENKLRMDYVLLTIPVRTKEWFLNKQGERVKYKYVYLPMNCKVSEIEIPKIPSKIYRRPEHLLEMIQDIKTWACVWGDEKTKAWMNWSEREFRAIKICNWNIDYYVKPPIVAKNLDDKFIEEIFRLEIVNILETESYRLSNNVLNPKLKKAIIKLRTLDRVKIKELKKCIEYLYKSESLLIPNVNETAKKLLGTYFAGLRTECNDEINTILDRDLDSYIDQAKEKLDVQNN